MTTQPLPPLPTPAEQPTLAVEVAGGYLGISRPAAYAAARSGELPTVRIGRRLLVPTAALRRLLEIDE
jgi:excisionase family DNA binding protein